MTIRIISLNIADSPDLLFGEVDKHTLTLSEIEQIINTYHRNQVVLSQPTVQETLVLADTPAIYYQYDSLVNSTFLLCTINMTAERYLDDSELQHHLAHRGYNKLHSVFVVPITNHACVVGGLYL